MGTIRRNRWRWPIEKALIPLIQPEWNKPNIIIKWIHSTNHITFNPCCRPASNRKEFSLQACYHLNPPLGTYVPQVTGRDIEKKPCSVITFVPSENKKFHPTLMVIVANIKRNCHRRRQKQSKSAADRVNNSINQPESTASHTRSRGGSAPSGTTHGCYLIWHVAQLPP